ncbi:MAG TPA: uroporphyrinogen-III C-methyltransferase [Candidatus Polarisedimenticolia bacterium]|jgi:uroporphyrin-III C-methyltransferase|nr:uroporphyrinogen-III C-methyltransferase [Candidatus Polarisedimenticolia bacterium]
MSAAGFGVGLVSLVGAGPGDPDLLTRAAVRRLRSADVVYYDALVDRRVLRLCRKKARRVPVGKRRGLATLRQEAIEKRLVRDALRGLRVVRLKGGDPFLFGRGGEEALALQRAGVPVEVIPGVSSGLAAPARAGIPVTHRGLASSAAFVTAHDLVGDEAGTSSRGGTSASAERLAHLARGADTLVIFMAGSQLDRVAATLLLAGLDPATPAATIENGTREDEVVRHGTLAGLGALGALRGSGPLLVVVGRTAGLGLTLGPVLCQGALAAATAAADVVAATAAEKEAR